MPAARARRRSAPFAPHQRSTGQRSERRTGNFALNYGTIIHVWLIIKMLSKNLESQKKKNSNKFLVINNVTWFQPEFVLRQTKIKPHFQKVRTWHRLHRSPTPQFVIYYKLGEEAPQKCYILDHHSLCIGAKPSLLCLFLFGWLVGCFCCCFFMFLLFCIFAFVLLCFFVCFCFCVLA